MNTTVNERFLVSPFFAFFLIYSSMISTGILKFQRELSQNAGYDAWISVILSGISINLIIWIMFLLLKVSNTDVIHINQFCFGKWIGNLINLAVILYFLTASIIVLRTYIEIVQVWIFPLMPTWQISIILLALIYYIVSGGFRIVTGVCFWGTIIPLLTLFPISASAFQFADFNNFLPVLHHSFNEILLSAKGMTFNYSGFESLLMFYPFLKKPEKSIKWMQFGSGLAILIYLFTTIVTFAYFTEEELQRIIWPTLTMDKMAVLPFIERFEYIIVSLWLLVTLPAISLTLWSACRGLKKWIPFKQRLLLLVLLTMTFILSNWMKTHTTINQVSEIFSIVCFYFIYFYIPLLFLIVCLKKKITKQLSNH